MVKKIFWGVFIWSVVTRAAPQVQVVTERGVPTNSITLGQQGVLEIILDQRSDTVPAVSTPAGISVRYTGVQQSMSIRNGVTTSTIRYRYSIEPEAAGEYTLGPIIVENRGSRSDLGTITVRVVEGGLAHAGPVGKIIIDQAIWVGSESQITIECILSPAIDTENIRLHIAPLEQCQLEPWTGPRIEQRIVNGQMMRAILWSTHIIPHSPGVLTVGPAVIEGIEEQNSNFFFPTGRLWRTRIAPMQVTVRELPTGIVTPYRGVFTQLSAHLDRNNIAGDEGALLTVKLVGSGVHAAFPALEAPIVPGLDIYPSTVRREKGCMQCEYIVRGSESGEYAIGPYRVEFFNTDTGQQETLTAESCILSVTAEKKVPVQKVLAEKIPEKTTESDLDASVNFITMIVLCAMGMGMGGILWGVGRYMARGSWWSQFQKRRRARAKIYTCCKRGDIAGLADAFDQVCVVYATPSTPEWQKYYMQLLAIKYGGVSLTRDMQAEIVRDAQRWLGVMTGRNSQETMVR